MAVILAATGCGGEKPTLREPSRAVLQATTPPTTAGSGASIGSAEPPVAEEPGPSTMRGFIARPTGEPEVYLSADAASARLPIPRVGPLGVPTSFAVVGADDRPWVQVLLPTRPNGSTAWVPRASVLVTSTDLRVTVDVDRRRLTAEQGGRTVLDAAVAVGRPEDPTPTGPSYVTALVTSDDPAGPAGPYAYGLALHADGRSEFRDDGQIAITGTDRPDLIGQPVTEAGIRLSNEDLQRLVAVPLPVGTPVFVR